MAVRLTWWVAGAVVGFLIGTGVVVMRAEPVSGTDGGAASQTVPVRDEQPPIPTETVEVAHEANVDEVKLAGAVNSTGLPPRQYLYMTGELIPPQPPPPDAMDKLIDCLAWFESRGDPGAVNRSSGAGGSLQFLLSTWLQTPQGRAGLSRFDPVAARSAARWMISQGRLHEWSTWRYCA